MAAQSYYTAPRTGTGTATDPYRPAAVMLGGSGWVGAVGTNGKYLLRTDHTVTLSPDVLQVTDLAATCASMGIPLMAAQSWKAGP